MSMRNSKKGHGKKVNPKQDKVSPIMRRRANEKIFVDIARLISEHDFKSLEEANAFLQEIIDSGEIPRSSRELTALEQAQDLMYEAWGTKGKRRVELAHRALKISEDCADAYVLLAQEAAGSLEEAKDLYEQGVKAGERALGPEMFEKEVGHFWGIIETRPYMRARFGLAQCLWVLGERRQAIEHYTDMLRLNPNDNQGVRYILSTCLLEEGLDDTLGKLLKRYKGDISAYWAYNWALWLFRNEGASRKANKYLKSAIDANRFVPAYLLGEKRLPNRTPEYFSIGDENEAIEYAVEAIDAWKKTEGALEWLRKNL